MTTRTPPVAAAALAAASILAAAAVPTASARPAEGKLDPVFARIGAQAEVSPAAAADFAGRHGIRFHAKSGAGPQVQVVIETASMADLARAELELAGARVDLAVDSVARAWVPVERLAAVASLPTVLRVRRPVPVKWDVTSQGVQLTGAARTQAERGASGMGVRVGVIDRFQGYQALLGVELPPASGVTFRSFADGGGQGDSNHGVDVAEIIHDMAPDAHLYLAVVEDDAGFRAAMDWLIGQGVQIINFSGSFGLFGDGRGNGPLHGKVTQAAAANILFVESSGNNAHAHWEGLFTDTDGDTFHEFAPGVEELRFTPDESDLNLRLDMMWDDWLPNAADPRPTIDYDICLLDSGGTILACALDPQNGQPGQGPFEVLSFPLPAVDTYSVRVEKFSGGDVNLELIIEPVLPLGPLNVPESSVITPADHAQAFAVGATSLGDVIREYSGRGPTNDGRIKPDIVAPDGVTISTGAFFGTSASAPHVSGAAALLKELEPGLSAAQLASRLRSNAVEVPADPVAGTDNIYGAGRLNAFFPTATPTSTSGGGGGGGGCQLVDEGGGLELLLVTAVVLGWAAMVRRQRL